MSNNWYEVWADEGLPQPYVLIVIPKPSGGIAILDPKEDKVVYDACDYKKAQLWLLEDEYTLVQGRMIRTD